MKHTLLKLAALAAALTLAAGCAGAPASSGVSAPASSDASGAVSGVSGPASGDTGAGGEETPADVFEEPAGEISDGAENRLHAQKAVMYLLMGGED